MVWAENAKQDGSCCKPGDGQGWLAGLSLSGLTDEVLVEVPGHAGQRPVWWVFCAAYVFCGLALHIGDQGLL